VPSVKLTPDDIILYKKRAILNLDLKPKTKYKFTIKSFDSTNEIKIKSESFELDVPENKLFGFKVNKKVSLFMDTKGPNFTFYKYNSDKKEAKLKICRIDNESYAKIEVHDGSSDRYFKRKFFKI
jgi:hypothetical protein